MSMQPPTVPVVYHTYFRHTRYLDPLPSPQADAAHPLPDALFIRPNVYHYQGRAYDLTREGIYRLSLPLVDNQQRIVYQGDLGILLSSLSWIVTHGFSDREWSTTEDVFQVLTTRKLRLSCGLLHSLGLHVLGQLGYRAHAVAGEAATGRGDYDGDGHSALEVYHPTMQQWVFCDLDLKAMVLDQGRPLAFLEMTRALAENRPLQVSFISPATRYDLGDIRDQATGFDFGFMSEAVLTEEGLHQWYQRVFEVPLVHDATENVMLFSDARHRPLIESLSPTYQWVSPAELQRRVYGRI